MRHRLNLRVALVVVASSVFSALFGSLLAAAGFPLLTSLPIVFLVALALAGTLARTATSALIRDLRDLQSTVDRTAAAGQPLQLPVPITTSVTPLSASLARMDADIRDRLKRVDEARSRLEVGFTLASSGLVALDQAGLIAYINPAARELLQVDDSVVGNEFLRAVHDAEVFGLFQRCLAENERQTQLIEYGSRRQYLQVSMVPLAGAGEWAALAVFTDLTEVRRLETMRRDFVSNVSHELRSPLASIKAVVETLESGAIDDRPAALDFLRRVDQEVDRLTALVEELLEISKLESGALPLKLSRLSLPELLGEAVRRMATQAHRAAVTLAIEDRGEVPRVEADADRIQRAIMNLLHNAIKFTPAGGEIRTWVDSTPDGVEIHVADNGVGIAPEDQARVFERFFKVDKARSSVGYGLGLAIVKHVAQAHRGTVRVTSAPGRGSEFVITLPLAT